MHLALKLAVLSHLQCHRLSSAPASSISLQAPNWEVRRGPFRTISGFIGRSRLLSPLLQLVRGMLGSAGTSHSNSFGGLEMLHMKTHLGRGMRIRLRANSRTMQVTEIFWLHSQTWALTEFVSQRSPG